MSTIIIKTQKELDELPESFDQWTIIEIRSPEKITVKKARGRSRIMAMDNSSIEAWENANITRFLK